VYSLALLGLSSFLLAFLLTPLCRNLFRRWGLVDRPDGQRKLHTHPIPRAGGVPIMTAYLGAFALLLVSPLAAGVIVKGALPFAWRILSAGALVFGVGLLDDLRGLKPWQKFAGQVIAGCLAFWAGVDITHLGRLAVPAWLSLPLTVVWLVGCSNAFNLIDGVDGLAAGAGFFATVTILLGGLLHGNVPLAMATVPLAGALLGFLRYNFNPASIFLGDSGSLTVGFLLGCYGVMWSQKSTTVLGMTAPLMALAVPLVDTGVSIARRFLRRQPVFVGDTGHIHHRLLARGLTPRRVALLLYLACGLAAGMSLLASVSANGFAGVIIVLFCGAAWIGVQHLGYAEFETARRIVYAGTFRRLVNAELLLRAFRDELNAAATPEECWEVIQRTYTQFGFHEIRFKIGDRVYRHTTNGHGVPKSWTLRIQLSENDYLNLSREFDTQAPPIVARFSDAIGEILTAKTSGMLAAEATQRHITIMGLQRANTPLGRLKAS
jgi:UDP-GlcNAc:undecaprenyl-phosphate GlcNAc-1-phosphate transferase